jgi:hypothetical protein
VTGLALPHAIAEVTIAHVTHPNDLGHGRRRSAAWHRVTGADPGVYVNTCGSNHAQLWLNQPVPVIAGGKLYSYTEFVNDHTRESPALNATTTGTNVLQQASGDTLCTLPSPSSSRGESHPPALTEPCLTVSRYTALLI